MSERPSENQSPGDLTPEQAKWLIEAIADVEKEEAEELPSTIQPQQPGSATDPD